MSSGVLPRHGQRLLLVAALAAVATGCDDADSVGVAAECTANSDCKNDLTCLSFKGGYCGLQGCTADAGCPSGSACVAHTDGKNYCFRVCADKPECNANRSAQYEANCSSSVTFVEGTKGRKACVPPS